MAVTAAILLNLPIFLTVVGMLLLLLIAVSRMYRHPTRPCPNCGEAVKLSSHRCTHCGYAFAPITFRR